MCKLFHSDLQGICVPSGFTKKGKAYFRVVGDGVLQVIKFQYERAFRSDVLYIGLFSMYGKLEPDWFTSFGSIPRYPVINCFDQNDKSLVFPPSVNVQIEMLRSKVMPWLDSITSQKKLVSAISKLDRRWNDEIKIAPYLACGETNHAKKVVREILTQHDFARYNNGFSCDSLEQEEDNDLYDLLQMIDRANPTEIDEYLKNNYARNMAYARFCIR